MNNHQKEIDLLNELLTKSYDAQQGYNQAADSVEEENINLRDMFRQYAVNRQQFANELISMVVALGGTPTENESVTAKLHQTWMSLKALVASKDEKAILSEVIKGESAAIESYSNAINNLPANSINREAIISQRSRVELSLTRVKELASIYS